MFNIKRFKSKAGILKKPLLVFMSDGFGLLGAVIENKTGTPTIITAVRSVNPDPETSLFDVTSQLGMNYGKLPGEAIMLHVYAVPALLELGIENLETLETSKINELIRWEMEALYSGLAPQDVLGWLMLGLGYITEEQRDILIENLELEAPDHRKKGQGDEILLSGIHSKKERLGEIALREGYINNQQLEICLKLQDELQLSSQGINCGWTVLTSGRHGYWLAAAINTKVHEQWVNAFRTVSGDNPFKKIRLQAFMPLVGMSAFYIPAIAGNDEIALLELHREYIALIIYTDNAISQCHIIECNSKSPQPDDVSALINQAHLRDTGKLYVFIGHKSRKDLFEALSDTHLSETILLEKNIVPPGYPSHELSFSEAILLLGAAQNHINSENEISVSIPGEPPPPPLMQRPAARVAAAVFTVIFLISGIEGALAYKISKVESELVQIKEQVNRQEAVKKDMRDSRNLQLQAESLKRELDDLVASKQLLESVLVTRQQFTRDLLDMISRNLNDHILINTIEETDWNKFLIEGWALDQASVDQFSLGLSRDLQRWDMFISANPSSLGRNAAGYSGYNFKFIIEKNKPKPVVTATQ